MTGRPELGPGWPHHAKDRGAPENPFGSNISGLGVQAPDQSEFIPFFAYRCIRSHDSVPHRAPRAGAGKGLPRRGTLARVEIPMPEKTDPFPENRNPQPTRGFP